MNSAKYCTGTIMPRLSASAYCEAINVSVNGSEINVERAIAPSEYDVSAS